MVERGGEIFCATAVALIEADYVEASEPGFFCDAEHVAGVGGAFESVEQDDCGMIAGVFLHVAVGANFSAWFGFEESRDGGRKAAEFSAPESGGESHGMGVAKERR